MTALLVVGDALLDVDQEGTADRLCPDAPVPVVAAGRRRLRPGGAGLAALLAARDGADVTLLTALGDDDPGRRLRDLLADDGIHVIDLGRDGETVQKTRVLAAGRPVIRLDQGSPGAPHDLGDRADRGLDAPDAVLVADYGLGVAGAPGVRRLLARLRDRTTPVVWDPHPRGAAPIAGCAVLTPNRSEAIAAASDDRAQPTGSALDAACRAGAALADRWRADHVCVTLGEQGAVLLAPGATPQVVGPPRAFDGDPCGAGDRFASRLALALGDGRTADVAVRTAVAAAARFVAAGGARAVGDAPPVTERRGPTAVLTRESEALELAARARDAGRTVVATGGCFDLLHAGHVESLRAARALGDLLVVCLNSDASVRRLKGPQRPIVPVEDRAAVLSALGCVDAVAVFEDDTPVPLLERLRPDVFVKGGDYRVEELPETPVLARWGGRVVTVPLVAGRSTTAILQEVQHRVG